MPQKPAAAMLREGNEAGEGEGDGATSMVSAKEERDLHTLLEMFAMGVGDVDQFQTRLKDELAALEVQLLNTLTVPSDLLTACCTSGGSVHNV